MLITAYRFYVKFNTIFSLLTLTRSGLLEFNGIFAGLFIPQKTENSFNEMNKKTLIEI